MEHKRGQWASNVGFILTVAGSAVGLENVWKLPGKVAAAGGRTFLIYCALIVLLVGFPVMLAELSIGRSTQKNVVGAFHRLNPGWSFAGGVDVLTLFVIMFYHSAVGGWVMKYITVYLTGADFSAFGSDSSKFSAYFTGFISRPGEPLMWGATFPFLCIYVVVRGMSEDIERVSKFLMPGLFILLTGIVIYAITLDGVAEGFKYMLAVDPAEFDRGAVVAALGQAFFFLSVGIDIMVTYGSYIPRTENLAKSAGCIYILDSLVTLLSGLAIVPVVYITAGPEAIDMGGDSTFMALPEVFSRLPGDVFFGSASFLLLLVAVLANTTSILESFVVWLTEKLGFSRLKATLLLMIPMSFLSAGYSPSQGAMDIKLPRFDSTNGIQYLPMNTVMEKFTDNLIIPLGALFFCLFVGWV